MFFFDRYYHRHSVHDGRINDIIIVATIVTVSTLVIPIIIYIDIRTMAQSRTCSTERDFSNTFGAMALQHNAWREGDTWQALQNACRQEDAWQAPQNAWQQEDT